MKRLLKKERWEVSKKLKRQKERLKRKTRAVSRKVLKSHTMESSTCKVGVVIDLSFDDLMIEKDIGKCCKQIQRCYSINRRQTNPLQFHITSFNGESAKMMEKNDGFSKWDVNFHKEPYDEIFDKKSIVYLTSESENLIESLEDDKFYIIGGLVDHNSKKGHCHRLAVEKGIHHARLPIDKFLDMKTRVVLTIDHVFEIMGNVSRGLTWQESLLQVIPSRKNASLKEISDDHSDEDEEAEDAGDGVDEIIPAIVTPETPDSITSVEVNKETIS